MRDAGNDEDFVGKNYIMPYDNVNLVPKLIPSKKSNIALKENNSKSNMNNNHFIKEEAFNKHVSKI